jgi:beta-glucosidase/6-phospho-beta-glucosidase/beta-galactosidase
MGYFEWLFGYNRRFGMCYVDYESLERTSKSSALWFAEAIKQNGENI